MVAAFINLLERRQQAGEVRPDADPAVIAELILALYDGLYGRLAFSSADQAAMTRAASQVIIDAFANPPQPSG
jgi:hypothetical protein